MKTYTQLTLETVAKMTGMLWKQPKFSADHFELREGSKLLADISFMELFSDKAVAHSAHGAWVIDRPGFFRDQTIAWNAKSNIEAAWADRGWLGDYSLTLAGKGKFNWFRTKILTNSWAMTDHKEQLVYEMNFDLHWFKQHNHIQLVPDNIIDMNLKPHDLVLLLTLGMHLGYCSMQDSAGAAAASTAAIV